MKFMINPKAPYDFRITTRRLEAVQQSIYHLEQGVLYRTLRIDNRILLLKISSMGTVDEPVLQVEIPLEYNRFQQKSVENVIHHMLQTNVDLADFYAILNQEEELQILQQKLYGLRPILETDLFACMVKTIIGQQLNIAFAATLNRRLVELAGETIEFRDKLYPVFPSPEQVARLNYDDLRPLQFSGRKAEYVIDFARLICDGKLSLEELQEESDEEILQELLRIRGVGRWSVECFLLFGMGRPDLLPAADIGLRNGIKQLYGLDKQPKEEEVRQIGKDWSPWSSYMTFYIWESLNKVPS